MDNVRTRGHSLRVKKMRIMTVLKQRSFSQRVVNAWNGPPKKVVAAEGLNKFKCDLDRYLGALQVEVVWGYWLVCMVGSLSVAV